LLLGRDASGAQAAVIDGAIQYAAAVDVNLDFSRISDAPVSAGHDRSG
jgi:hypothetical protein